MKKTAALFAIVLAVGMTAALDADAKRLGGAKSGGMQRQTTSAPANTPGSPQATPGIPAQAAPAAGTAAAAPGAAAAAAPKRSWMGPVAGLAAGLGLAALASHLGFGEALANMMLIGLVVMAVLVVIGLIMRKRAAAQGPAIAGAPNGMFRNDQGPVRQPGSMIGSGIGGGLSGALSPAANGEAPRIPADFDTVAFARNAKDQFLALQAANDAADMERLRDYLTPEMFELVRAEIAERGDVPQKTEVFGLDAQVLEVAEEADRYIVSVRFGGSIRDQHGAVPEDLDEIWHLTKPRSGMGGWLIAGIQQAAR